MAQKKEGGSSKNNRDSAGRRLGVKRSDGQLVTAGSIIIRQRGFKWRPGNNIIIGRDHTLSAKIAGRVKFVRMKDNRSVVSIIASPSEFAKPSESSAS